MDILDVIKGEHEAVSVLLDEAQGCKPGDKRIIELARQIERYLTMHVQIEERLFYARLRERAESQGELIDMYEAYTEHDVADHLIQLLQSGRKPDEKFKAELQVLGESVKHHVKEEESKVFSIARKVIDQAERDELGEKWAKAKLRLESQPAKRAKPAAKAASRKKSPKRAPARRKAARKAPTRKAARSRR